MIRQIPDLLSYGCAQNPDGLAVISEDKRFTYRQLDGRANRLVSLFRQYGLQPGTVIALLAKNEAEFFEIQVAALRSGLTLLPLNFRLAVPELEYILVDSQPGLLIFAEEFSDAADRLAVDRKLPLGDSYDAAMASATPADDAWWDIPADAAFSILYTSGTTGRPKGAVISNHALIARINSNMFEYRMRPDTRFLMCLQLFHIGSITCLTLLYIGATVVVFRDFEPRHVLDLIPRHRITMSLLVPTMINTICNHPEVAEAELDSLELVFYGGSPISPTTLATAIEVMGCEFLQTYGMTETNAITFLRPEDHDPGGKPQLLASAGTPALGVELRVVDGAGRDLAAGTPGEIICRSPGTMDAYLNRPEATAETLRDGWLHTGDIGYLDDAGYLFVSDRKKDMIVSGGENVYPREVEDVLHQHPSVLEAAVIGVPDDKWGERVHAVLVARAGQDLDSGQVIRYCRDYLAGYKVPKSAELVAELPKTATGKVAKNKLREVWWRNHERSVS